MGEHGKGCLFQYQRIPKGNWWELSNIANWVNKIKPKLSVVDKSSTVDSMQQNYVEIIII